MDPVSPHTWRRIQTPPSQGKKTPGVDRDVWDTPEKKIPAVHCAC